MIELPQSCRECQEPLPRWAQMLGICAACLVQADQPPLIVPQPTYRPEDTRRG